MGTIIARIALVLALLYGSYYAVQETRQPQQTTMQDGGGQTDPPVDPPGLPGGAP